MPLRMSNRRHTSPKRRKPWQPCLCVPAFLPVPLRARRDGWTPQRQACFIGLLAQTGCVRTAAQMLGLSGKAPIACAATMVLLQLQLSSPLRRQGSR